VEIPDIDRFPADGLRRADEAEAQFLGDRVRRADEAEANPEHGDRPTTFDRAFNAELPGLIGDETE
jgi:hypothetical protein